MIEIRLVDTTDKKQVNAFIQFHFDLYKGNPYWVPPFRNDIAVMLDKKKHPFYEHSEADFFTAWKDGKMVGRVAVLNNRSYNKYHNQKKANYFLYDSIDDQEVCNALFNKAAEWAKARDLNAIVGPKGFSIFDGYGVLVEGFEELQSINMSAYNYAYYQKLLENYGFSKINEFLSMKFNVDEFRLPEKVFKVAEIVEKRGKLKVFTYKSRKDIIKNANMIAQIYMKSFVNNWEFFPMSDKEFKFMVDNVITLVDPKLIKFIQNEKGEMVGLLINFPDISKAMQRHDGRMTLPLIIDILFEMRRTKRAILNGIGLLEEYHGSGGNALLYTAMQKVYEDNPQFKYSEAAQMAESAKEIQQEMKTLGLVVNKRHRVYEVAI